MGKRNRRLQTKSIYLHLSIFCPISDTEERYLRQEDRGDEDAVMFNFSQVPRETEETAKKASCARAWSAVETWVCKPDYRWPPPYIEHPPYIESHQLLTSSTNFIKITHCIQFLSTWVSPVYKRKDLAASRILLIQVPNHLLQRCDTVESSLFFADTPSLPNFRQRMHQTHGSLLYLRKIEVNGVFMNTDPVVNHSLLLF